MPSGKFRAVSISGVDLTKMDKNILDGLPNPEKFEICRETIIGDYVVVHIRYPDCINFEGNKLVVYNLKDWKVVKETGVIDPHFVKLGVSPIARFIPNLIGSRLAIKFLDTLVQISKENDYEAK